MREKLNYDYYAELEKKYSNVINFISNVRVIMFIIMVISFVLKYYYYKVIFNGLFIFSFIMFIIMVVIHDKYFKIYNYYNKYIFIMDKYLARENGEWKKFSDTGEDYLDDTNIFLSDLDVLGKDSLFQYLSICNTLGGRERLINKLSNFYINEEEFVDNQKMIQELADDILFCIRFQIFMDKYRESNVYLSLELFNFKRGISGIRELIVGILFGGISGGIFILGIIKFIPMEYFYLVFLFNFLVSCLYFYIYRDDFNGLEKLVKNYSSLVDVLELVSNYNASSDKMNKMVKRAKEALKIKCGLKRIDWINSLRNNLLSNFLFNGFICLNLLTRYYYLLFLENNYKQLFNFLLDIEELEACISLANIGILKDDKCMPVLSDKVVLKFDNLKHPLIDEEVCVSNSFDSKNGVNIITGSNMGGKTTFLRTIGINLILMQSGTYVCSSSFCGSYFKLFTSMRIRDDVSRGISTFYGELLRIKDMVEYNGKGNMLVLIDEIFKGTNYNDRIYGALEVIKKLNNSKTIAFITTHDFELCESDNIKNYYVKEEYEDDKIIFDYKVRKGKCNSTNAKYLMEKIGIINTK